MYPLDLATTYLAKTLDLAQLQFRYTYKLQLSLLASIMYCFNWAIPIFNRSPSYILLAVAYATVLVEKKLMTWLELCTRGQKKGGKGDDDNSRGVGIEAWFVEEDNG